jgi:hypothetical protein
VDLFIDTNGGALSEQLYRQIRDAIALVWQFCSILDLYARP